jgi:hypothetical protein
LSIPFTKPLINPIPKTLLLRNNIIGLTIATFLFFLKEKIKNPTPRKICANNERILMKIKVLLNMLRTNPIIIK